MTEKNLAATNPATQQAKKDAEALATLQKTQREVATAGKPTPTQEENDRAALGEHIPEHEPDGSPEQPIGAQNKQVTADRGSSGGGYQTRASEAPRRPAGTETHKS